VPKKVISYKKNTAYNGGIVFSFMIKNSITTKRQYRGKSYMFHKEQKESYIDPVETCPIWGGVRVKSLLTRRPL